MASKGVVSMEELKRQLGDSLPAAVQIGARAMGMTTAAFDKAVSSGQVMSRDFIPKFAKQVRDELGGSFVLASSQMRASINRVQNSFFALRVLLGEFFGEWLNSGISDVSMLLDNLVKNFGNVRAVILAAVTPVVIFRDGLMSGVDTVMMLAKSITTIIPSAMLRAKWEFENFKDAALGHFNTIRIYYEEVKNLVSGGIRKGEIGATAKTIADRLSANAVDVQRKTGVRRGLIDSERERSDDEVRGYLEAAGTSIDKRLGNIAEHYAKVQMAISKAAGKTVKSTEIIESGGAGGVQETSVDEKALKRQKKLYEEWLKIRKDAQKRDYDDTKALYDKKIAAQKLQAEADEIYENARIQSIPDNASRELVLLDAKYKAEREKFSGNREALLKIERAYTLERSQLTKKIDGEQRVAAVNAVSFVASSLKQIIGENKKFVGLYKAAAIVQIVADTAIAAQSAYKSAVQSFGAYGIPAGVALAAVVSAAGAAQVANVASQKMWSGATSFRTSGPTHLIVGDNPGGREKVTVTPESSQNVNGPIASSGSTIVFNLQDNSGGVVETFRRSLRSGGDSDRFVRDFMTRARALGATT